MTIFIIYVVINIYAIYQGLRCLEIGNVRMRWKEYADKRFYLYSFNDMFIPSLSNWFGIRWPNEKQYKET